jgi:hypothetical protein
MKIALLGYGYWGKIVFKYLKNDTFFELVKVFDMYNDKVGIFTNNIDEIMEDEEIEGVYIATPVSTHFKFIKLAIEHKKLVFCEKVLVTEMDELNYIKEHFSNKIIESNYIYTDSPSLNYIKNNLDEIGEIKYIEGEIKQFGNFYLDSDVYSTIGCHLLSGIMHILNSNEIILSVESLIKREGLVLKGIMKGKISKIPFSFNVDLLNYEKRRNLVFYGENGIFYFNPLDVENTVILKKFESRSNKILLEKKKNFDENNNIILALKRFKEVIKNEKEMNLKLSITISEKLLKLKEENHE